MWEDGAFFGKAFIEVLCHGWVIVGSDVLIMPWYVSRK